MSPRVILRVRRTLFFLAGDLVLLTGALFLSFLILAPTSATPVSSAVVLPLWALSLAVKVPVLYWQRLYAVSWSFVALEDLLRLVVAFTLGSAGVAVSALTLRFFDVVPEFPAFVLLLDYTFGMLGVGAFRISRRVYLRTLGRAGVSGEPTLVVGAGAAGEHLARSLLSSPQAGFTPVGFLDDDPALQGTVLHGVRVLGPIAELAALIHERKASRIVIAMPSAPSRIVREVVALARSAGLTNVGILPSLPHILDGGVSLADVRDVRLEDLLGREVVSVEMQGIVAGLSGKRVLVTGAGGTIGAELCRQVLRFGPSSLALLDQEETALFGLHGELEFIVRQPEPTGAADTAPPSAVHIVPVLADIRDERRVREVFEEFRPEVVLHAAAYKHVGMLERHPEEAVRTNVLGTAVLAEAAMAVDAQRFVLVSTDKAVEPTSVMGATKRVAEQLCLALNSRNATRFMAVRFGNVLGSRGSVIPIFQEQIRRREPITVRGINVRRYFMAVSEAVLLVLQAGTMGKGGEVFVLEMGKPIKILDLAYDLIRLSGLEPDDDVPIAITELGPGEKEFEDILTAEEGTDATGHEKIYVARLSSPLSSESVLDGITRLRELAEDDKRQTLITSGQASERIADLVKALQELVPTYRPSEVALSTKR